MTPQEFIQKMESDLREQERLSCSLDEMDMRHGAEEKDWADEEGWWWWREAYSHELDGEWIPVLVTDDGRVFITTDTEGKWTQLKYVNASGGGRWCKIPEPPDWKMPHNESDQRP